jgi:hypothetical protein
LKISKTREEIGVMREGDGGKNGIRDARIEQNITGKDGWFDIILVGATCGQEYFC